MQFLRMLVPLIKYTTLATGIQKLFQSILHFPKRVTRPPRMLLNDKFMHANFVLPVHSQNCDPRQIASAGIHRKTAVWKKLRQLFRYRCFLTR